MKKMNWTPMLDLLLSLAYMRRSSDVLIIVLGTGAHILVDTGTTHNVIDINFARLIDLLEKRINTMTLVGSGNKVSCWAACFNIPLYIDADTF